MMMIMKVMMVMMIIIHDEDDDDCGDDNDDDYNDDDDDDNNDDNDGDDDGGDDQPEHGNLQMEGKTKRPRQVVCVYWDYEAAGGRGAWSPKGCRYLQQQNGRDVCVCDHLTNFAILMVCRPSVQVSERFFLVAVVVVVVSGCSGNVGGGDGDQLRHLNGLSPFCSGFREILSSCCSGGGGEWM